MKQQSRVSRFLRRISTLPLSTLRLSRGKRLLIVALSYGLAIPGLWFFLPRVHNAASMLVPIVITCWLFRYRGLLLCIPSILVAIWLVYLYLLPYALTPGQIFEERAVIGFGIGLLTGLGTCWLRTAVDLMQQARAQAFAAEQERLQATLAYEYQCTLNELKDQFLLNVSHELRTPLMVLGSSLELLKEYLEPTEAQAEILTLATANHEELASLVNRVLDAVTVTGELLKVQSEAVPVHQIVQEVLTHLNPRDREAYTFHVEVPSQVTVWADPQYLRQVLRNLIENVVKYVPKQTEIRIETAQPTPSSPVCLTVQDAGPGIPAEELPYLFGRFVRLRRDLAGVTRGTGLGLYICKQLVEAMGGHIWVESSGHPGEGSRFCVALSPIAP
jgi:signal transduction histidine kinase